MEYTHALDRVNMTVFERGIRWHLKYHHYPPVPEAMIPNALQAIRLCWEDEFNATIPIFFENLPFGLSLPAHVIVEAYHLEPWVVNELY